MPKKEVELKSKPQRSRIQVSALCINLRAGNQALLSYPHGWRGIHRLFVLNYFHYRNQQRMLRGEISISGEKQDVMLFLQSHNETQSVFWEHASISLYHLSFQISLGKKGIFCFLARNTNSYKQQIMIKLKLRVALVCVWQPSLPYLDSAKEMINLIGQLSNHSECKWTAGTTAETEGMLWKLWA